MRPSGVLEMNGILIKKISILRFLLPCLGNSEIQIELMFNKESIQPRALDILSLPGEYTSGEKCRDTGMWPHTQPLIFCRKELLHALTTAFRAQLWKMAGRQRRLLEWSSMLPKISMLPFIYCFQEWNSSAYDSAGLHTRGYYEVTIRLFTFIENINSW